MADSVNFQMGFQESQVSISLQLNHCGSTQMAAKRQALAKVGARGALCSMIPDGPGCGEPLEESGSLSDSLHGNGKRSSRKVDMEKLLDQIL